MRGGMNAHPKLTLASRLNQFRLGGPGKLRELMKKNPTMTDEQIRFIYGSLPDRAGTLGTMMGAVSDYAFLLQKQKEGRPFTKRDEQNLKRVQNLIKAESDQAELQGNIIGEELGDWNTPPPETATRSFGFPISQKSGPQKALIINPPPLEPFRHPFR